jgi:predicted amidohydrolase
VRSAATAVTERDHLAERRGPQKWRLAAANMAVTQDKSQNLDRIIALIGRAARQRADLLVLPELALQGYADLTVPPNTNAQAKQRRKLLQIAETVPGPSVDVIVDAAYKHKIYIQVGLAESDDARTTVYNTVALIGPTGVIGIYRKMHNKFEFPFYDTGHSLAVTDIGGIRCASAICYDMCFPEFTRCCALAGAEVILNSSAWAHPPPRSNLSYYRRVFDTVAQSASLFNQVWSVHSNQCQGSFVGHTQIVDPQGIVVARAAGDERLVVHTAEIHEELLATRTGAFFGRNFMQDRRPERYGALVEHDAILSRLD